MHDTIPLNLMPPGDSGEVVDVLGGPEHVHRIHELGLRRGVELQMVRDGNPCIVRLAGQTLCFRACDVLRILVRPRTAT